MNVSVRFDKSDNALEFVDDAKLVIGTGNDLTNKFSWIHGEYALNHTLSTNLL